MGAAPFLVGLAFGYRVHIGLNIVDGVFALGALQMGRQTLVFLIFGFGFAGGLFGHIPVMCHCILL
jgi:hypothetical protein